MTRWLHMTCMLPRLRRLDEQGAKKRELALVRLGVYRWARILLDMLCSAAHCLTETLLRWMQAAADYPGLTKEQRLDILVRFSTSRSHGHRIFVLRVLRHPLHCAIESDA